MSQGDGSTSVRDIQYGVAAANISGTVGIHYHHTQTQPQTPPLPTHNIPFDRNTHFVNREEIFSQISVKCDLQASRAALVGLGGVGKSQLAIEYGHRTRLEHEDTWVLWCHASNTARLNSSLSEIASLVRAPGHESPQADHFKLVKTWLHDPRNRKWLLIIDNVDDKAVISQQISPSTSEPLRTLYQGSDGRVLITSRTKDAVRELVEDDQMLEIHPMDPLESQILLKDQLGLLDNSEEDLRALASALENMPLALTQAAAYIRRYAPKTSVKQYLELFNKNDQTKINLLSKKAGNLHRDWDAKSCILTTLMISFKDIRETSPSAADILCLMSFLDRQGIPEELIRPETGHYLSRRLRVQGSIATRESQSLPSTESEENDQISENEEKGGFLTDNTTVEHARESENYDFESDIEILRDYAFIKMNTAGTFEIHSLVQLATGNWLKSSGDYDFWRDRSIEILSAHFSCTTDLEFLKREKLIAHVKMAIQNKPKDQDVLVKWARLMNKAGKHEMSKNFLHDAMQFSTLSWNTRAEILGRYNSFTLYSLSIIGMIVFRFSFRHDHDEQVEQHFLQDTQNLWQSASNANCGRESWAVLFRVCEIASQIYIRNGKHTHAETLLSECISSSAEYFGPDSQETLALQTNFANLRKKQGDMVMAEKMLSEISKKLISIFEASQQHSNGAGLEMLRLTVMNAMSTWAKCLESQNNPRDAEARYRDLLLLQKSSNDSPYNTILTETSLATFLVRQNRLEDAAQVFEHSEKWQKAQLGQEYHTVESLGVLFQLARTYMKRNESKTAIPLFDKVLRYRKEFYGNATGQVLNTMKNLASAYMKNEAYSKALSIYKEYMASEEGVRRVNYRGDWKVIRKMGYCYYKLCKYEEAIRAFREYLNIRESTITKSNIGGIVYTLKFLGHAYKKQKNYAEAAIHYRICLEQQKSSKGEKHEDTLETMVWISDALHASGQDQEAIAQLEECVQLSIELLGPKDTKTVKRKKSLKKWRSKVTETHHEVAVKDSSASLSSILCSSGIDGPDDDSTVREAKVGFDQSTQVGKPEAEETVKLSRGR